MLALFCKLVNLFLGEKCVKGLRVTKIVKQIKSEGVLGELQATNCSRDSLQIFFCFFTSLLTGLIVKNSYFLAGIYFTFLKKRPRPKLEGFKYQIWASLKI